MKTSSYYSLALLLLAFTYSFIGFSQTKKNIYYDPLEVSDAAIEGLGDPQIRANTYKLYAIDVEVLRTQLVGIAQREDESKGFTAVISFPHPDGTLHEYQALGNRTLSKELSEKYPEIKTYDAADAYGRKVKWDITPKGLHVMILQPNESTVFVDPVIDGNDQYYIVYYKKDFTTDKVMSCQFGEGDVHLDPMKEPVSGEMKTFGTCELRTYRLALAATGEYTIYHGGTVGDAQAAQAVSMNRVNGIFERDIAITMTIVPNNDQIIYTNPSSDPYANGNPGTMINQNQFNCDNVIGNGNYDIGHVFGTNSGGLAGLGVVCNNSNKARGVTGSANPVGDPFDVDYVAHEMGHQFGANHTQNNPCNSVAATRMEPGSASTIMGYAGICAPNVQSNSDDHFHGISLEEMHNEIMSGGHTCELITPLANNPPIITGTNGNVTIPANTPFMLTANVTDADGDPILYCWEQMDNQASTQPPLPTNTGGPNFRSNSPDLSPTRYFPNLNDLSNGVSPTWEVIPSVSRTMNFRVTVRDQGLNVPGCNDHEDVTVTFDDGSGPFVVTYPSATGIVWTASTSETVTWDVANTDQAPVNCSQVDIYLSIDGGLTYPYTLATSVANDGAETITVPAVGTTTARVMVVNANGTFFDISDNDFEIINTPPCQEPDVPTVSGTNTICEGNSTTLSISSGNLNDATDWQWYDSSCGVSSVGSGNSIVVSPTSTTTYYVRGEGGCTSMGVCTPYTVTVNPVYNMNESASVCQGQTYTYPDGATGTATETHTSLLSSMAGCDSIIVTSLTVMPSYNMNESASICDGNTYTFPDGTTGTTTQTYTSALTSVDGCDSLIVTDLTVVNTYNMNESATICDGNTYTFPDGTTGSTSQTYTSMLTSSGGCDSIIVTDLIVEPTYNMNESATICEGEIYTFPDGTTSGTAQTYTSLLSSTGGCDSIIVTNLSVNAVDASVSLITGGIEANLAAATYQWVDCDDNYNPIAGETNQDFYPSSVSGNYAVIVTDNGCSDTSACTVIDQTSIHDWANIEIKYFPNPVDDVLTIQWDGELLFLTITDARGRKLATYDVQALQFLTIDFSEYAKGLYFMQVRTASTVNVFELIKE